MRKQNYYLLIILLITFFCFAPSLQNEFVNWDDESNFVKNELITSLNKTNFWENTKGIFSSDVIGNYNPLTIWTFLLEQKFFGQDKPMFWHLNNIILHLVCTFFIFWIGLRLQLGLLGASIFALLFGIHPMRVESVAWVTERKDVLYGAFYLAALFYYIKGKQEGFRKRDYLIIGIAFLLSLLSKIQAVVLPVSLILVDYYFSKDSKITMKSIIGKIPFFAGSLTIGLLGIHFLGQNGSLTQPIYFGIDRLFIGSLSLTTYFAKSILPYKMSPLYPYPSSLDWTFYASIVTFIITPALLLFAYIKKWRTIFFGLAFFIANVILLLQIVGAGQGFLADRFTYIAYFGLFFLFAYFLEFVMKKFSGHKTLVLGLTGLAFFSYGYITFQQNKIWRNSATLFSHVLKYYNKTATPWRNRANYFRDIGETQKALYDYSQVVKLNPDDPNPYNSIAKLYFNFNHTDSLKKALFNCNKAIELKPDDVEYLVNRGVIYAKLGDFDTALLSFARAEKIDPGYANIYLNRYLIYSQSEQWHKALGDMNKYLNLNPNYPDMWYEKGRLHEALSQPQECVNACSKAISINPKKGLYYFERAKGYYLLKNYTRAKSDMQQSLRLDYEGDQNVTHLILNAQ
ncbi:MAG: tetratricopeptide repeat protein [Ekhidna sp.]|nr:tetratricopeptide repeat protein [Ekhidna sp.]